MQIYKIILSAAIMIPLNTAWAERTATRAELIALCNGTAPSGLRVVSNPDVLQAACAQLRASGTPAAEAVSPGAVTETAVFPALADAASVQQSVAASAAPVASSGVAADPSNPCSDPALTAYIPPRQTQGIPSFSNNMGTGRDNQIAQAVRSGNIPDFLRNLRPVTVNANSCMGSSSAITFCVMPDYLSVGDNQNYIHTPVGIDAATQMAGEMGFFLPTTRMVDAIYSQGQARVAPSTRTPNASMTTTSVFTEHSRSVQRQFDGRENLLRVGHKKDVVMTNRTGGVPIYGWHRPGGSAIQSLYLGHQNDYSDYSHGIRMVSQQAFVNGQRYALADLLRDPQCSQALSSEGSISAQTLARYPDPVDAPAASPRPAGGESQPNVR